MAGAESIIDKHGGRERLCLLVLLIAALGGQEDNEGGGRLVEVGNLLDWLLNFFLSPS